MASREAAATPPTFLSRRRGRGGSNGPLFGLLRVHESFAAAHTARQIAARAHLRRSRVSICRQLPPLLLFGFRNPFRRPGQRSECMNGVFASNFFPPTFRPFSFNQTYCSCRSARIPLRGRIEKMPSARRSYQDQGDLRGPSTVFTPLAPSLALARRPTETRGSTRRVNSGRPPPAVGGDPTAAVGIRRFARFESRSREIVLLSHSSRFQKPRVSRMKS